MGFFCLGACVHGQVAPSPRLSCDGTWEQCLLNDLGRWLRRAERVRSNHGLPSSLRRFVAAEQMRSVAPALLLSARASHGPSRCAGRRWLAMTPTRYALPLRSARHALERVWSSAATMRPATGRLALVDGLRL